MLVQLKELSKKAKINMFIESTEDVMQVIVFFEVEDSKKNKLNIAPLVVSGTAEELDNDLVRTIEIFTSKNISSLERIDFITKSITKAEKSVTKDATEKTKSTKKTTTPVKKKAEPAGLFSAEPEAKKEVPTSTLEAIAKVAEVVTQPETGRMAGIAQSVQTGQASITEQIAEVEKEQRDNKANSTVAERIHERAEVAEVPVPGGKPDPSVKRTEAMLERVAKLTKLGFIEKPEENQFVRGGLGIGTTMILTCDASTFLKHYKEIEANIAKSKAMADKPTMSFSDFQTEELELPVAVAPVPSAPIPAAPVPEPIPVVELTIAQDFINLVNEFKDGGYDTATMHEKDYPTHDSIKAMRTYLQENPLIK